MRSRNCKRAQDMSGKFDKRLRALLRRCGISEEAARYAGIYSVQNAREAFKEGQVIDVERFNASAAANGSAIVPYLPRVKGLDWQEFFNGPGPLVIVNDELQALKLCLEGTPAIAVVGVSKERVREWLQERGANIVRVS